MATQEVTGRQVLNGTLTNDDISASAAIAFSKLDLSANARCLVYRTATQSINSGSETVIAFPTGSATEDFDVGGMHDLTTNDSRLTVPTGQGGLYLVGATWGFSSNATGTRNGAIKLNGSTYLVEDDSNNNSTNGGVAISTSTPAVLAAGDYIELYLTHSAGVALNSQSGRLAMNFWAVRIA